MPIIKTGKSSFLFWQPECKAKVKANSLILSSEKAEIQSLDFYKQTQRSQQ